MNFLKRIFFFVCFINLSIAPLFSCEQVVFLGDSNTALGHLKANIQGQVPLLHEPLRYSDIVQKSFSVPVINQGRGGHKTYDFYPLSNQWNKGPGIYIVTFGLNDARDFKEKFDQNPQLAQLDFMRNTTKLINMIRAFGGQVVLMTNGPVDYPNHHSFDQNKMIDLYDDVYRNLASRYSYITLLDMNHLLKAEIKKGNWDLHIRDMSMVAGQFILDQRFDHTHGHLVKWFTNIHYNINGCRTAGKHIVSFLKTKFACQ